MNLTTLVHGMMTAKTDVKIEKSNTDISDVLELLNIFSILILTHVL